MIEHRGSGELGCKLNDDDDDDDDDTLSPDEVPTFRKDRNKGQLLGRRQDGHRIRFEGDNETNDGAHQRRLEQSRQTGKLLCPILPNGEWVQLPK